MFIFTPTKRIFLDNQILSHWYLFEAQLVSNNIWKDIEILSTEFLSILICIYENKFWWFVFFSKHHPTHSYHPKAIYLALSKYNSTKSYWKWCLKAMTVGHSVGTMYDTMFLRPLLSSRESPLCNIIAGHALPIWVAPVTALIWLQAIIAVWRHPVSPKASSGT